MQNPKSKRDSFYVSLIATALMTIIGVLAITGVIAAVKLLITVIVK